MDKLSPMARDYLIAFAFMFIATAFVLWSANPADWAGEQRSGVAFLPLGYVAIRAAIRNPLWP